VGESANELEDFYSVKEEYRIMDFGESEQEIDDYLYYDFIVVNARELNMSDRLEIIAENEQKVFDAGKQAEYDAFWDAYQPNTDVYPYHFTSSAWNDNNFFPKRDLIGKGNIYGAFYSIGVTDLVKRLKDLGRTIDTSQATLISNLFRNSASLTTCPKISAISASDATMLFSECARLKEIECLEVHENITYTDTFYNCKALENITFEGEIGNDINFQWSTKLTKASITNIINHLSDTSLFRTLTLSKEAVLTAFEVHPADYDGDGKADAWIGNGEGEWYELIDTKSNWEIVAV
jgi:hypothetical protein